jgi:bifunctional non-homologous end joining protein LigD
MQYEFSLPTKSDKVPAGPNWIHEIKYDGYRMMLIRDQDRVRLISRGGHDWSKDFPLIVAGALKLRQKHFAIDGEVVVLDKDGMSDFHALASHKLDKQALLYAFDVLASGGEDSLSPPCGSLFPRGVLLARDLARRSHQAVVVRRKRDQRMSCDTLRVDQQPPQPLLEISQAAPEYYVLFAENRA